MRLLRHNDLSLGLLFAACRCDWLFFIMLFARIFESRPGSIFSSATRMLKLLEVLLALLLLLFLIVLLVTLFDPSLPKLPLSVSLVIAALLVKLLFTSRLFEASIISFLVVILALVLELFLLLLFLVEFILFLFDAPHFFLPFVVFLGLNISIVNEDFLRLLQEDSMSAAFMDSLALVKDEVLPELNRLLFVLDTEINSVLFDLLSSPGYMRPGILSIVIHQSEHNVLFKGLRTKRYQVLSYLFDIISTFEELELKFVALWTRIFSL